MAVVLLIGLPGCASQERVLYVAAASSLAGPFGELETEFERLHPDVDVVMNFAGSSTLRYQILEGAPIDVFASASMGIMQSMSGDALFVGAPIDFATNSMTIIVPEGNPADVKGLQDFEDPGLFLGACEKSVPCGELADEIFERAGFHPSMDVREPNAVALVGKVEQGELDAAIAYQSDVSSSIEAISIPQDLNASTSYPIVALNTGSETDLAREFVELVTTMFGQETLARWGFGRP